MNLGKIILLAPCFGFAYFISNGQIQNVQARIIDSHTNEAIPFATVKMYADGKLSGGVVSNQDGDFQLPVKNKLKIDSMVISCIGYRSLRIDLDQLSEGQLNVLKLSEGSVPLKEVVITGGKKLTARKIVRFAIQHIPDNYPHHPYSYIAYYRDYQREQSQYVNLNEAIIEVFDKGFGTNDLQSTREKLYQYRQNDNFPSDSTTVASYELDKNKFIPGVRLSSFGGNELSILRIHDALRNNQRTTYSFVNVFSKDFVNNHAFKLLGTVYLNQIALYKISVQSLAAVTRQNHTARGEIYIEHGNYAIHKLSYATYERKSKEEKLLYTIELEYARDGSQLYLNYISCNNFFLSKSNESLFVTEIVLDKENQVFKIHFNHPPATKSALHAGNYQIKFEDHALEINKIEIAPSDDKEVILWISPKQAATITDLTKIQVGFRGIRDKMGRAVDEIVYKEVNQFRELFLQKLNPTDREPSTGPFIVANRALKQNEIDSTKSSSNYWMNTPLKK